MATKPMGQLGGTPRVVAMQPKCHPTQQIVCLEFLAEVCQNSTSCLREDGVKFPTRMHLCSSSLLIEVVPTNVTHVQHVYVVAASLDRHHS